MGKHDNSLAKGSMEVFKDNALAVLASVDRLRDVFDGKPDRTTKKKMPDNLKKICEANVIPLEDVDLAFFGNDVSLNIGKYLIRVAVCPKNLVVGLLEGKTVLACFQIAPKKKTANYTRAVRSKADAYGIFIAIISKFSEWNEVGTKIKQVHYVGFDGSMNLVHVNVLFYCFKKLPLDKRVDIISKITGLAPSGVNDYLYLGDNQYRDGLARLIRKGI